jgi:hypothetical protein
MHMVKKQDGKACEACGETSVPDSFLWIKDSKGYGSVTVTFATVAFWVTTFTYIASMFERIGPVTIRPFDVAACSAYFVPVLTLYFGRKMTEAKYNGQSSSNTTE